MKDPRYPYALDLGSEVGGYRIEAVLGAGGFGITYRAFNEVTHKTVAIKEFYVRDISTRSGSSVVVDTDISEGTYEYALRKFQEEAQSVVSRFSHPYVIKGENFIKANNTSYVIMEYVEGGSLEEWLTAHPTPPSEAEIRPLFEKLFQAVDYVHSQNVMHRDITPRNIMIRGNGEPVLIDFGAAGHGIDRGRSSKMVAQMRYAPPEQTDSEGPGQHGRYTDIFSLGGVLYRTITGKPPVAPMTRLSRLGRRGFLEGNDPHVPAAEAVADRTRYSPQFLAGVDMALRLDEQQRPQSIGELRTALGWTGAPSLEEATTFMSMRDASTMMVSGHEGTRVLSPRSRPLTAFGQEHGRSAPTENRATPSGFRAADTRPAFPIHEEPKKRSKAGLAAAAIVFVAAGGGVAYFWPQIVRQMEAGPRIVAPFAMTASIDGRTVTLTGYAPSEAVRQSLGDAVRRGASDTRVDNRLEVAAGAPGGFAERAAFAIERIGKLDRGSVRVENDAVRIEGTAADPDSWSALERDFATALPGGGHAETAIRPAVVAPYLWTAQVGREGLALAGYVPSPEVKAKLRAAAERGLPNVPVRDATRVAEGEPPGFAEAAALLIPRLADLTDGRIQYESGTVQIEGRARSTQAFERASAIDATSVPGNPRVSLAVRPPVASPYEWSATYDGQSIVLRGYSPSREVRRDLLSAVAQVQPGTPARDETEIADGAPADFPRAARFALDVVPRLARGRVAINGETITIDGAARNPADFAALSKTLGGSVPGSFRLAQNAVNAPRISPYPFNISLGSGIARLTGFVPSEALRKDVVAAVSAGLPGIRIVDETQLGDGAPENFLIAVRFGVAQAGRLASGRVALEDGNLSIEGTIRTIDDLKPLKDASRNAVPRGITIARVAVGARSDDVPAQDCDRLALPADHPDKPVGETGLDLSQIDAERAVPACQTAVQNYPNVRRFYTALGYALQKRGQHQEASREYRRAAEADDPTALTLLAGAYREGLGLPQDYAQAFELYNRAAALGSPAATHAIGWMYENGLGRTLDPVKAAEWYTRGAALGVAESYTQLGWLAQYGLGRKVDYQRAADQYERGAKLGSTLAMHQLGTLNQNGLGRTVDLAKAYDWYARAAQLGRAESMAVLGTFNLDGIGRPVSYDKAAEWFERAAAAGSSAAMHQLGVINLEGLGRRADTAAAIVWFERAAAIGRSESMFRLGLVYQNGTGVPQDYARAFEWYQKGARANDPGSIHQIGWAYENGLGRPVDLARAFDWYNRAAGLGYAPSMHQIGWHYESGRGRPTDYVRAAEWYRRAADQGYGESMNQLGWLALNGLGRSVSEADALGWFDKAANAGNLSAMWNAALLLDSGRGGPADPNKAASWLLTAFARREANAVDALSGDMAVFGEETRKAVQRILQRRGLYRGGVDGLYTQETRRAVFAYPGSLTN